MDYITHFIDQSRVTPSPYIVFSLPCYNIQSLPFWQMISSKSKQDVKTKAFTLKCTFWKLKKHVSMINIILFIIIILHWQKRRILCTMWRHNIVDFNIKMEWWRLFPGSPPDAAAVPSSGWSNVIQEACGTLFMSRLPHGEDKLKSNKCGWKCMTYSFPSVLPAGPRRAVEVFVLLYHLKDPVSLTHSAQAVQG